MKSTIDGTKIGYFEKKFTYSILRKSIVLGVNLVILIVYELEKST